MKAAVFSTEAYDREFLTVANADAGHDLTFYEPRLTAHTCALAAGFPAICASAERSLSISASMRSEPSSIRSSKRPVKNAGG